MRKVSQTRLAGVVGAIAQSTTLRENRSSTTAKCSRRSGLCVPIPVPTDTARGRRRASGSLRVRLRWHAPGIRIPQNDRGRHQVEAAGAIAPLLERH